MPRDYFERHVLPRPGRLFDEEESPAREGARRRPVGEHRLLDVDAFDRIAAVPGGYDFPPLREPSLEPLRTAARELVDRWTKELGRRPTRAEWASLYDADEEPRTPRLTREGPPALPRRSGGGRSPPHDSCF